MARFITLGKASRALYAQRGFGYLAVLLIVLMLAVALGTTYERLDTIIKREKEQEWLFAGQQYKQAISSYYNQSPNGLKELPSSINDLLKDRRFVTTTRHLRKPFADAITGGDWMLIIDENHKIKGVYSSSNAEVLQIAQLLHVEIDNLVENPTYANIKFEFNATEKPPTSESDAATGMDGSGTLTEQTTLDENAAQ
jgi:type II secretory pathway pseudopilin PulG